MKKFIESTSELDLACKDKIGRTVLFKFLLGQTNDCVKGFRYFVYKHNADLTIKDKYGDTLFHEAVARNNLRMLGELIAARLLKLDKVHFAELLAMRNKKGKTALDIAHDIAD